MFYVGGSTTSNIVTGLGSLKQPFTIKFKEDYSYDWAKSIYKSGFTDGKQFLDLQVSPTKSYIIGVIGMSPLSMIKISSSGTLMDAWTTMASTVGISYAI